jgi:hypothetical protein
VIAELYKERTHFLHVNPKGGFIMKMLSSASFALPLGALLALSFAPAQAAPLQQLPLPSTTNVELVQYNPHAVYWHGYRGSRVEKPGMRRHSDGYWYPLAAFGVDTGTTGSIGVRAPAPVAPRHTYCQSTFGGTNGDGSMPCGDEW